MPRQSSDQPKDLAAAERRIARWRASSTTRRRIPEKFWSHAVGLAKKHGINRVSEAMRLSHERLTERLKVRPHSSRKSKRVARAPRFVEVSPIEMPSSASTMSIDLVDGSGRCMTVRGVDARDVRGLVAAFFRGVSE